MAKSKGVKKSQAPEKTPEMPETPKKAPNMPETLSKMMDEHKKRRLALTTDLLVKKGCRVVEANGKLTVHYTKELYALTDPRG